MKTVKRYSKSNKGIALVAAMIFVAIFAALSVGFLSFSSANTQIADNHSTGNNALNAALSGLEMVRYWCSTFGHIAVNKTKSELFVPFYDSIVTVRPDAEPIVDANGVLTGFTIGPVALPAINLTEPNFFVEFTSDGDQGITVVISGRYDELERKIRYRFTYDDDKDWPSVFDFGVATKGPLTLKGGTLSAATIRSEADVYIESLDNPDALAVLLNKSEIAGVAKVVNPNANITADDIRGKVGGLTGQDAINQTIEVGAEATEFPIPNAVQFKKYATGGYYTSGSVLENKVIKAGTGTAAKPLKFTGSTTINGVLYIEQPNYIDFGGNVTVNGMIVAEGDYTQETTEGSLAFTGSVDSSDQLAPEKGTFIMAPGFALSFTGSFGTVNGAIAANGVTFDGNAGGTIKGSVLNYATTSMYVDGSSDIIFNRSGTTDRPAGFEIFQKWMVYSAPDSYSEI